MIKTLISTYLTRKDQQRTIELLDAASKGDDEVSTRSSFAFPGIISTWYDWYEGARMSTRACCRNAPAAC